jgi:hypothetical protein
MVLLCYMCAKLQALILQEEMRNRDCAEKVGNVLELVGELTTRATRIRAARILRRVLRSSLLEGAIPGANLSNGDFDAV